MADKLSKEALEQRCVHIFESMARVEDNHNATVGKLADARSELKAASAKKAVACCKLGAAATKPENDSALEEVMAATKAEDAARDVVAELEEETRFFSNALRREQRSYCAAVQELEEHKADTDTSTRWMYGY